MTPIEQNMIAGRSLELNLVFRADPEDGGFIAECLEIPGCMSQGETMDEAKVNITEAIDSCLSVMFEDCIARGVSQSYNFAGITEHQKISVVPPHLPLIGAA